jgi:hypothetical protein
MVGVLQDNAPNWLFVQVGSDEFWTSLFTLLEASSGFGIHKLLDTYPRKHFMDVILKKLNFLRRANDAFDILFSLLENMGLYCLFHGTFSQCQVACENLRILDGIRPSILGLHVDAADGRVQGGIASN